MPTVTETVVEKDEKSVDGSIPPPVNKVKIEEQAEQLRKIRELPPKPGTSVTFKELCNWLKLLTTEEMRKRVSLYVYRLFPIIIRQQADPNADNNIDVICDGFSRLDTDYFINTHGGGLYKITVADCESYKDPKKGGGFSATLEIPLIDVEPKLDYREVDWVNPKNKGFQSWARAKGKIDSNNMAIDPHAKQNSNQSGGNGNSPQDTTVQVMKTMMDFFSKMNDKDEAKVRASLQAGDPLSKSIGDILVEKMRQDDPTKTASMFTSMMTVFTNAMSQGKNDGGTVAILMPMFQMMMESQKETTKLILETIKSNQAQHNQNGEGEEKTSKLDELRSLIEIAKELKGGGGSREPSKTTTELLIDKGLDVLGPVLNLVGNIVALKMSQTPGAPSPMGMGGMQGGMGGNQGMAPGGQQPIVRPQPTGQAPPNQQMQPTPISAPANPIQNGNPNSNSLDPMLMQAIREFAPLILANLGKDGYALPDMICQYFPNGDMIVAMIIKHGPANILNAMKAVPELWNQISGTYGEEHAKQWVEDFVNYKQIIAEIESGEDGNGDTDLNEDNDGRPAKVVTPLKKV